jgi:hypothetical protein
MSDEPLLALPFTDTQIDCIMAAASPLDPDQRARFLELVAANLAGREIGDGLVARVCAECQARFFTPPDLSNARGTPRPLRRIDG